MTTDAADRTFETLLVERRGGVVTVTLNRPDRRNALNMPMFAELRSLISALGFEYEDRVLVLTGAGGNFCAGGDLSPAKDRGRDERATPSAGRSLHVMRRWPSEVAMALHELAIPTIAAVEGAAVGAGANLAFGCDLVVAAEDARFAELFVHRGLGLDAGGSWLLPRLIGLQQAKRLAFMGDDLPARDAAALGLVTEVAPAGQALTVATRWATSIAARAPLALSVMKKMLHRSLSMTMADAVEQEAIAQSMLSMSKDGMEAVQAFFDKRAASFVGD